MPKRLTRLTYDRKIAGVCGGIAKYLNIDPTVVRLVFIIALIISFFTLALIYLVAIFLIPNESEVH